MLKNFLANCKRAKKLIEEDDERIRLKREQQKEQNILREEIKYLRESDLEYVKKLAKTDLNTVKNPATLYKELNRIRLSLYIMAPTLFRKALYMADSNFFKGTLYREMLSNSSIIVFDAVYIRNSDASKYEKSLNYIENLFNEEYEKGNIPPKEANLDDFVYSSYSQILNDLQSYLEHLNKLLKLIATLK